MLQRPLLGLMSSLHRSCRMCYLPLSRQRWINLLIHRRRATASKEPLTQLQWMYKNGELLIILREVDQQASQHRTMERRTVLRAGMSACTQSMFVHEQRLPGRSADNTLSLLLIFWQSYPPQGMWAVSKRT